MELDKILPNEVAWGVVDHDKNVPMQQWDDYNTASSENNYSTSILNSPSIQQICNVFTGLDPEATDLDVNYDSDGNKPLPISCDNINASKETVLGWNKLNQLRHKGTKNLSIFVFISVDEINKMKVNDLCSELKKRGLPVSGLKKALQ